MSAPDTVLNDRYVLGEELGRGGMGTVYRAHDPTLSRDVAVKILNETGLGTEGRAKLLREAQAVAQLSHPNIVTVHDAGELEGSPYIVMEYVEGASLHERPPGDLEEALAVARQITAALEHAHAHDIIHRDLKPENVIVDADGNTKLMDFGLARSMATRVSVEGEIVGTVFYIAPEVAMGKDIDGRADLYSLGVMLYEFTTGELPFVHEDPLAVVSQHLHATVLPPRAKNPDLPPVFEQLILRLLSKEPDDRPDTATALLGLLDDPDLLDLEAETDRELSVVARIARGRFVARSQELEQAKSVWSKTLSGNGQTLLVSGEPGIGKTRLVRELSTHVEVSGGRSLLGESYAEGGAPYAPFAQIVRRALRDASHNGSQLPDFVLADLLTLAPELGPAFPNIPPNPVLEPEAEQHRLFENVVSMVETLTVHSPLMLVVDDAHWSDSSTLALIRHLARRTGDLPVLLVATYREVELDVARPLHEMLLDLNRARLGTRLKLERLDMQETESLLHAIFDDEITPEFLEGIYRETEGNPFFIEEVCRTLVEEGQVYFADGEWHRPANMEDLQIPQSVRIAIQSRVAKLPQEHQEILVMAAVLGREFEFEALVEASGSGEEAVISALESAENTQLIEEAEGLDEDRFRFVHALMPVSLLESVRKLRRRKMHQRAAVAIEARHPDDYEALAHHYSEAGDDQRALRAYERAGHRAAEAYANQEAEQHYRSALDLVSEPGHEASLRTELGLVLERLGRHEEAMEQWAQGIVLYEALDEPDHVAYLYARSARAAWEAGDPKRGLEIAQRGMEAVENAPDGVGVADLLHELARAWFFHGEMDEGSRVVASALEMAESVGAPRVLVDAMITHGTFSPISPEDMVTILGEAADLAHDYGLPDQEARARNNRTLAYGFGMGRLDRAREEATVATGLARSTGSDYLEVFYGANAIWYAMWAGDFTSADELDRLEDISTELADPGAGMRMISSYKSGLLRFTGHTDEAARALRDLFNEASEVNDANITWVTSLHLAEIAIETGEDPAFAEQALLRTLEISYGQNSWHHALLSRLYSRSGDLDQAQERVSIARAIADTEGALVGRIMVHMAEADLAVAEDRLSDADARLRQAAEVAERCGMRWYRADTMVQWASMLTEHGDPAGATKARELLAEAASEFEAMGAEIYHQRAVQRLAELAE